MANQNFKTTGGIEAQSATLASSLTLGDNASYNTSRTITLDSIVIIDPIDGISYYSQDNGVTFKKKQLPSDNYSNVINDGTKFYAMGDQGNFVSSVDGATWVSIQNDYNGGALLKLAKSGSKFVAIANNGDTLHSPNGISWTKTTHGTPGIVTTGGNVFIAASSSQFAVVESDSSTYWYSSNGTSWLSETLPIYGYVSQLSYGNGNFLLVGNGTNLLTSTDALSWDTIDLSSQTGLDDTVTDIQYLNGNYIAVSHGAVTFSTDLINWTTQTNLFDGTNAKYIAYTNNQYFVAEENTLAGYTSTDLINWNAGQIINPGSVDNGNISAISGLHINTTVTSTVAPTAFSSLQNLRGDIQDQLDSKAGTLSPTFKGTVVLPQTTSIGTTTSAELGYVHGVTSSIQTQLNSKVSSTAPSFTINGATITSTEIAYLDGLTGNIQDQINAAGTGGGNGSGGGTTGDAILDPMFILGGF